MNNYLDGKRSFLKKKPFDTLFDKTFMVVAEADNANERFDLLSPIMFCNALWLYLTK